jgi:5-methylcytosine-specific restriction endonuclease McrA
MTWIATVPPLVSQRFGSAGDYPIRRTPTARSGVPEHFCPVRGPRCTVRATTVHHIVPSSLAPERFFDPTNLQAACATCNRHGALVQSENRNFRMAIANLERLVEEQRPEIERLTDELAAVDREPALPRIY